MKSLYKYLTESTNTNAIKTASGKWYMTAKEVQDALNNISSSGKKPAKFIFNNVYVLFPDYDQPNEWGVSEQFSYNEKIWYCALSTDEKNPEMPAYEVISYDFKGTDPKDIICEGDKWNYNNGVYNAKNKKFRITSIYEDKNYIVFTISNTK